MGTRRARPPLLALAYRSVAQVLLRATIARRRTSGLWQKIPTLTLS